MRTLDHVESPHKDDVVDKKVEGANVCTDLVGSGVGGSGIVVQIVIEVGICAACVCEDVATEWNGVCCDDEREQVLNVSEDKSNGVGEGRMVGVEV